MFDIIYDIYAIQVFMGSLEMILVVLAHQE